MRVAFDLTCTGLTRKLLIEEDQVMTGYVRGLLSQFPCMRMEAAAGRDQLILKYGESADGIIYHTVQFCDNYSYEYAWLKGDHPPSSPTPGNGLHQTELRPDPHQDRGIFRVPGPEPKIDKQKDWRK